MARRGSLFPSLSRMCPIAPSVQIAPRTTLFQDVQSLESLSRGIKETMLLVIYHNEVQYLCPQQHEQYERPEEHSQLQGGFDNLPRQQREDQVDRHVLSGVFPHPDLQTLALTEQAVERELPKEDSLPVSVAE